MQTTAIETAFPPAAPGALSRGPDAAPLLSTARPLRHEPIIRIPALGLTVRVRFPFEHAGGPATVVETTHAAGFGPPMHRRAETGIFEIVTGRYLFEVEGQRFIARRGDLVRVPAGAAHAWLNVTGTGARQQLVILPGIDAASLFRELAALLGEGRPTLRALRRFAGRWGIVVVGTALVQEAEP